MVFYKQLSLINYNRRRSPLKSDYMVKVNMAIAMFKLNHGNFYKNQDREYQGKYPVGEAILLYHLKL